MCRSRRVVAIKLNFSACVEVHVEDVARDSEEVLGIKKIKKLRDIAFGNILKVVQSRVLISANAKSISLSMYLIAIGEFSGV